ncbi:hypothetical protein GCM10009851_33370 [Herbiconiux moechotypicola]|uniref:Uncharacterized protein n=1 Tax=Herbiconiux moechotypicola TaxID=637393 RepID=A0ABN3DZP8_9MICO
MSAEGWLGRWIEPVPVPEGSRRPQRLRVPFVLPDGDGDGDSPTIVSARARVAARGDVALFINDRRLDAEGPSTGPAGEPIAREYDAISTLVAGENVVGLILGESWGATTPVPGVRPFPGETPPLAVLFDLVVELSDGSEVVVVSDESFRCTTGAIIYSEPGRGERQEHALRDAGWKEAGFDDARWTPPRIAADQSLDAIVRPDEAETQEAVRVVGESAARTQQSWGPGGQVLVDFGRRLVGRLRVRFTLPAGSEVTLEHLPAHPEEGEPTVIGTDVFVSAGTVDEVFEPGYALHDFRYVRVTGLPAPDAAAFSVLELSVPAGA